MDELEMRENISAERRRLAEARDHLLASVLLDPDGEGFGELALVDQHPADIASEVFEREVDLSIAASFDAELDALDDALAALDAGTYGLCEICGQPIPEERLRAVPATKRCVDDEDAIDRAQRPQHPGSPGEDAAEVARREAQHNLDLVPSDELQGPDGQPLDVDDEDDDGQFLHVEVPEG